MKKLLVGGVVSGLLLFSGISHAAVTGLEIEALSDVSNVELGDESHLTVKVATDGVEPMQVSTSTPVTLETSSDTGEFGTANEGGCTGGWGTASITIANGDTQKRFCYRDSEAGAHTITATAVSEGWEATFEIIVNEVPSVTIVGGENYDTLQEAVDAASPDAIIELDTDLTISHQVTIDKTLTIEGNGHTLFAPFAKVDIASPNDNNSAIGIIGVEGSVVIRNLTIDGTGSTGSRHGMNVYQSSDVALEDVTIVKNNAAGLIVNSSTVTANDLNTSGNVWYGVNVDKNASGDAVFTLTGSGVIAEAVQIISDKTVGATVAADGYEAYTINGTTKTLWTNRDLTDAVTIGSVIYSSIQSAIDNAAADAEINVAAGTYEGFTIDSKTGLTISGTGKGETIISPTALIHTGTAHKYTADMLTSVFVDHSTGVLIQDLTIESNDSTPGSGGPDAIVFWNASSGTLKDCAVTGTYAINGVQSGQGIAVDASGSESASLAVDNCEINGFQKNGIDAINGNGATEGATGSLNISIVGGALTGAGATNAIAQNGLVLWNRGGGIVTGSVDGATISGFNYTPEGDSAAGILAYGGGNLTSVRNSVFLDNELHLSTTAGSPSMDAINNYWGSVSGPEAEALDGVIAFDPWFIDTEMSILSSTVAAPDESGVATVTASAPNVVLASVNDDVVIEANGVADASVILSSLIEDGEGEIPQITVNSDLVKMEIPSTTITSADEDWDGVLALPTVTAAPAISVGSGTVATAVLALEVGDGDNALSFDEPVKLTFAGQAGNSVGWSRAGAFSAITEECDSETDPDLGADDECYVNIGSDLVVWTRHFTTFVTYTVSAVGTTQGGGGHGVSAERLAALRTRLASDGVSEVAAGEVLGAFTGPEGEVLGAETEAKIASIKAELVTMISQLISLLQAQLAAAIAASR